MKRDSQILELLDILYRSAVSDAFQPDFLDALSSATDTHNIAVLYQDFVNPNRSRIVSNTSAQEHNQIYSEYAGSNIYVEAATPFIEEGVVVRTNEILSDRELMRSEFYSDFCRGTDFFQSMGATVQLTPTGFIGFTFNRQRRAPFSIEEQCFIEALMPHLQNVARLQSMYRESKLDRDSSFEALNQQPFGVQITRAGRPRFCNRALEEMVGRSRVLVFRDGCLNARDTRLEAWLADSRKQNGIKEVRSIHFSNRVESYNFVATPYIDQSSNVSHDSVTLHVLDVKAKPISDTALLEAIYGLTPREVEVAIQLAAGHSVKAVAELLCVNESTIATHKKSIFLKMDVRSLVQLANVVSATRLKRPKA